MNAALRPLLQALDRAADDGRTIRVWLRDDDCVAPTPALDRLATLCDGVTLPVLLAVIPAPAEAGLAGWIADHPGFAPCQHGFSHTDHARPGERSIELGGSRALSEVLDDLARGRDRLTRLFGPRLSDILVPPWNRIHPAVVPELPGLGFTALSTIAARSAVSAAEPAAAIPRLDCDLDIIDWRCGRIGRPLAEVANGAAGIVARQDRLGLLTHHLAHDAAAWAVLGSILENVAVHPAVRFVHAGEMLAVQRDRSPPRDAVCDRNAP